MNLRISALGRFSQLCVRRIELGDVSGTDRRSADGETWGTANRSILQNEADTGFSTGADLPVNYDGVFFRRSAKRSGNLD